MKIKAYRKFQKYYKSLPGNIQRKIDKQLKLLVDNFNHPSLHTKRVKGTRNVWEIRIGNHDKVLKNP